MRPFLVTSVVLALIAGATSLGAGPPAAKLLRLKVSTHSGPLPLDLTLTGNLGGVDLSAGVCIIRWDRTYKTAARQVLQERAEFPCPVSTLASPGGGKLTGASFQSKLTLEEPGDYSIRIIFKLADGRQVAGTTQEVRVYRGEFEAGATGTREDD